MTKTCTLRAAVVAVMVAAMVLAAAPARAQSADGGLTQRPLTLRQGTIELWAPVQADLSAGREWKPVFLNPSLSYGVTDRWTVGLRHFVGVCLGEEEDGCRRVYDDVSVETSYLLGAAGPWSGAARLALDWAPIDPSTWSVGVGAVARFAAQGFSVTVAPSLDVGLNDRDQNPKVTATPISLGSYAVLVPTAAPDNREYLHLPATILVQVLPGMAVAGAIAANGPLNPEVGGGFDDHYTVPVSAAAVVTPMPSLDLGAHFTWTDLAGATSDSEQRIAGIFAAFRP